MRTTVTLDPDADAAVRKLMAERGISFKEAVNQAILSGPGAGKPKPFKTKSYNMGKPLVDLTHANTIVAQLDDEEFLRKMQRDR